MQEPDQRREQCIKSVLTELDIAKVLNNGGYLAEAQCHARYAINIIDDYQRQDPTNPKENPHSTQA